MATLKELHELVAALDKREKKHINLMIAGIGGKAKARYLESLRLLNSHKQYDVDRLKPKLAKHVAGMNLSEANTNFYNFICKAIFSYHGLNTGGIALQKELLLIDILMSKGLYETANRMLQPLIKRLAVSGTFAMQHRAQELQNNIYINFRKLNIDYNSRYRYYQERLKMIDEHRQFVEITILNTRFFELAQQVGDPRTKIQLHQYTNFARHQLLQLPFSEVTTRGLGTFITLKLALENMAESNSGVYELSKAARTELKKRFTTKDFMLQDYYVVDFISAQVISQKDEARIKDCIAELQYFYKHISNAGQQQKIQARILMAELTLCSIHRNIAKTEKLLAAWMGEQKKQEWIKANLGYINLLTAARLLYLGGKPDKALDYLLLLQPFEKSMRPSLHISYRFLFLLCHYKLKNYQFLMHATESLYRYLLKLDKVYAPEKALLRFVKKCDHFDKVKDELKVLSNSFKKHEADFYHRAFFVFGDYREWLDAELK